jgi:hypothetical protein
MKLVIHGTTEEIQELVKRLPAVLGVAHVSRPYSSQEGQRVYIDCTVDYFTCPGCRNTVSSEMEFCDCCGLVKAWSDKNIAGLSGIDLKNLLELPPLWGSRK